MHGSGQKTLYTMPSMKYWRGWWYNNNFWPCPWRSGLRVQHCELQQPDSKPVIACKEEETRQEKTREEWFKEESSCICSSDISPYQVFLVQNIPLVLNHVKCSMEGEIHSLWQTKEEVLKKYNLAEKHIVVFALCLTLLYSLLWQYLREIFMCHCHSGQRTNMCTCIKKLMLVIYGLERL